MAAHDLDVMTPFAGVDVNESEWQSLFDWLVSGPIRGELSDFAVGTTAGRNVSVGAGRAWIKGKIGENSTAYTQPVAVNSSGNPRIDRVVLRVTYSTAKVQIDILTGTPAGSPVAPTLTQNTSIWEISLAALAVANGFSAINSGDITDERRFAYGRPPGGPSLIASDGNRDTNFAVGDGTWTKLNLNSADGYDTAAIHDAAGATPWRFTVPGGCGGLWRFTGIASWAANATGDRGFRILGNGSVLRTFPYGRPHASLPTVTDGEYEVVLVAGDYVEWEVYQSSGGSLNVTAARCTARLLGSLAA